MNILNVEGIVTAVLNFISALAVFSCKKIPVKPKKIRRKIVNAVGICSLACMGLNFFNINIIEGTLGILQKYWPWLCAAIFIMALLPPATAFFELGKSKKAVTIKYILGNLIYNIAGAICATVMIFLAYMRIQNFKFLEEFYVAEITLAFVPLCLWIALSYQHTEQHIETPDHSPSLKWKNQILNIVFLTNVYFWALISSEMLICYTLYCYVHHVWMEMDILYLFFLSLVLGFFYICGCNRHRYLFLLFLTAVPAIMVCAIQWMTWFVMSDKMLWAQMVFIIFHFGIYLAIIYRRERERNAHAEKNTHVKKNTHANKKPKKVKKTLSGLLKAARESLKTLPILKERFFAIIFVIFTLAYFTFWTIPLLLERIDYDEAANHISALCSDTENTELLLEKIKKSDWYDEVTEKPDVDKSKYLSFMYENLRQEMIDKNVISQTDTAVTYKQILVWFSGYHSNEYQ